MNALSIFFHHEGTRTEFMSEALNTAETRPLQFIFEQGCVMPVDGTINPLFTIISGQLIVQPIDPGTYAYVIATDSHNCKNGAKFYVWCSHNIGQIPFLKEGKLRN